MKRKRGKVMNDLFLSMLGDEAVVQPILSNQKDKKGQRQSLRESLQTLERIAQSQPSSPMKRSDHKSSKIFGSHIAKEKEVASTVVSIQPQYQATENDTISITSARKIVNDSNDVTPVTPYDEQNQGGIFASIRAVFTGTVFRTDQKKQERSVNQLEDSIVIEKKSSEEAENSGQKQKKDLDLGDQEEGLPQTVECEDDYASYQSRGEDEEASDLRGKLGSSNGRQRNHQNRNQHPQYNDSFDPLNEAQINSKPISMNVLDELESYWEKTEAREGKKGILAEHIMERQAREIMNGAGGESEGHSAFCMF